MDQETVRTICYLARLRIDQDKSEKIQKELETIIELIGGLQSIDKSLENKPRTVLNRLKSTMIFPVNSF